MLYEYDVPVPTFRFDKLLANIGSMSNSGFELGIGMSFLYQSRKTWNSISRQYGMAKNKLLSLNGKQVIAHFGS